MKRGLFLGTLMLVACGQADRNDASLVGADEALDDGRVECRIRGAAQFERFCTIDREQRPQGQVLVLRKPDGGFRRLLVATDGRGVVAADGAEPAAVTLLPDNRIEVAIGGDRFRLPARVRRP